ncbi:MAG: SPOR domain-containing protein [Bacteroidales bacterium]|nr:SPOR domain-containing protein [Bacteroidales bacterium]
MKKFGFIVAPLVMALILCTGCDFIRASLGKPTSKDLVKISDELKAREQYLRDSVAAVRAAGVTLADSGDAPVAVAPAAAASVADPQPDVQAVPAEPAPQPGQPAVQPAAKPAVQPAPADQPLKRYYAVAGAFKNPEGVRQYVDKLEAKGLSVHLFDFKSGLTVVCLEGHDVLAEAQQDVATLKELKLSDSDPWIYNTKQNLHK